MLVVFNVQTLQRQYHELASRLNHGRVASLAFVSAGRAKANTGVTPIGFYSPGREIHHWSELIQCLYEQVDI